MDNNSPEPSTAVVTDSEAALLLANIDSARRGLEKPFDPDDEGSLGRLEEALNTYGSVKHLLPKLNLSPAQRAPVEAQLRSLRAQILARG